MALLNMKTFSVCTFLVYQATPRLLLFAVHGIEHD